MAKQSDSMASMIRDYLIKDPDITWGKASADLEPLGISESYFGNTKTKLRKDVVLPPRKKKSKTATAKKPSVGTKVKTAKPVAAPAKSATPSDGMTDAVQFARSVGGLDEARNLLDKLSQMQV